MSPLRKKNSLRSRLPELRTTNYEFLEQRQVMSAAQIIAENALPGTSPDVWDVDGSGSANIQGYAAQMSVNVGERVDFKIDTDADDYRIDIYRMGYYGGLGARLEATIHPNAALANNQPDPLTDFSTGLVDAGNWRVSASWNVPTNAVSGVYIAKLSRQDGVFGESQIIFIVRDDNSHSDLLFQTSDTTWVAYSDYGGSSLYGNGFLPTGRAYEVSYNRPLTTRDRAESTNFFSAEYPMVRFLEENGYDVSYSTGIDTAMRGSELLEHKVFVSVGHDEYWSGEQRANVEAALAAGVNLAFFSGNEMFWKTRWGDSIDSTDTPYRTLISYKETHDNAKTDPDPNVWTGTWRDPRFSPPADGGRPENGLTGTLFTVNGDGSIGTSMTVGSTEGKMRFWRNTAAANLTGNQTLSIGQYILGYEWDEDIDNGFRPDGLFHLSTTTVNVSSYIQDYGSTYAPGTATHHMTEYRAPSGALVFGAGTIQYSWGLDSYHDGPQSPADKTLQQATVNLFADMGVQPGKLMPGLVAAVMSTDYAAPISAITSPLDGAVLQAGVATTIRGTAQDLGGGRVSGVEVSTDGGETWHPATGLENWTYSWTPRSSGTATILSRAIDDSGNIEKPSKGITINPGQSQGLYSFWNSATTPATADSGDAQAAELGVRFRVDTDGYITSVKFYKAAGNSGTHVAHLWANDGTLLATATFTSESASGWQQVDFATPIRVSAGGTYVASYTAPKGHYSVNRSYFSSLGVDNGPLHAVAQGPVGANGVYIYSPGQFPTQSYQSSNYWVDVVFNTVIANDTTPPKITKFGQAGGGIVVTTASSFTVSFNEALDPRSITASTMTLVKPDNRLVPSGCCPTPGGWCSGCPLLNAVNNTVIPATVSYDTTTNTATITPNSPLDPATVYTIIVGAGGVKDLAGNALDVDTWDSFYTSNQPAPVQSTLWNSSAVPAVTDSADPQAVELGTKFTADADGTITGARFYKSAANTGTHTATLWTSTGQQLATATFSGETASGWQQVLFSAPVAIKAGTTYVISYHTNSGHYSTSRSYFNAQYNSGPLHVPANGGVYLYGAGGMPTNSFQGSNYWVDAIYSTTPAGDTVAPTVTNFEPFGGTQNVPTNPTIKIHFSEPLDTTTVIPATVKLLDGGNLPVPATLTYDQASRTATLTPTSPLVNAMTYTIFTMGGSAGIRDVAGNPMAQNTTSAFTTVVGAVQDKTPPTITAFTPADGAASIGTSPTLKVTFSEAVNAATVKSNTVYLLKNAVTLVPTTLTYDAATKTATLIPTTPLLNSTSYTIYVLGGVSGVKDLSDNAMTQNVTSAFTTIVAPPADTTPPTVAKLTPTGAGVATNTTITATFSEALSASSVTSSTIYLLNTATNQVVPTSIAYTAGSTVVTLTPTSALANTTSYQIVVKGGASGVKDVAGNALAADSTLTFTTVEPPAAPQSTPPTLSSLWPASTAPSTADSGDNQSVELGVKFTPNTSGLITSLRFYKSAANTGVHTASLWSSTGTLLATATFTNETASGWQQVTLATPVAVTAGTTYVASYHTNSGHYSVNRSYFNSQFSVSPLTVPANGGVYAYGKGSFPTSTFQGSNYWVDVVLSTTPVADTTPPTVAAFSPANGSSNVAVSAKPTITFSESVDPNSINTNTVFLRTASNVVVAASVAYNTSTKTATLTPTTALANSATYTIVVKGGSSGVKDLAGNALATDATATLTTVATTPPTAPTPAGLWSGNPAPAIADSGDNQAVELGVKFTADVNGSITGIRFYKSAANTGVHTASLWSTSGQLLATGTFTNETASGWQTLTFATPVAITAGTTYVASYHTNSGHYAVNRSYFTSQYSNGPLKVQANGGVYSYGKGGLPTSSYQGSNYWIDPLFLPLN